MSTHPPVDSNVFYLPAPWPETPPRPRRDRSSLPARLRSAWWRFRLACREIRAILLRPRPAADEDAVFLAGEAELVERRPRPSHPARVIDFETARRRLRSGAR